LAFHERATLSCFTAKSGSTAYMHGGVSLQEYGHPLIHLERKEQKLLPVKSKEGDRRKALDYNSLIIA